MTEDDQEHIEADYLKLFNRAQAFYDQGEYREALDLLDELDEEFPHTRTILYLRGQCLRALGLSSFAPDDLSETEDDTRDETRTSTRTRTTRLGTRTEKRSVEMDTVGIDWDEERVAPEHREGKKYRKVSRVPPPMWLPSHSEIRPDKVEVFREKSDVPFQILLAGLFGAFAVAMLISIFGDRPPGFEATFAEMRFAWIPPETPEEREERLSRKQVGTTPRSEAPLEGYWIGQYEVIQSEWSEVLGVRAGKHIDPTGRLPVNGVSLEMCLDFVDALNRMGKGHFRLPTEEEWERASRAGIQTVGSLYASNEELESHAWYGGSAKGLVNYPGTREPNPWGIYDMYGNVEEWCLEPKASDREGEVWHMVGLDGVVRATVRGGSAKSDLDSFESLPHRRIDRESLDRYVGLRIVRDPGPGTDDVLRVIEFPEDRSLGTLFVRDTEIGPARGEVQILVDDKLTLVVGPDEGDDLSPLLEVDSEVITRIVVLNRKIGEGQLIYIAHFDQLTGLDLSNVPVSDKGAGFLQLLTNLRTLDLSGTGISGEVLRLVQEMDRLSSLSLANLPNVNDGHLGPLKSLSALRFLDLEGTSASKGALTEMQVVLPLCEILPLPGPPNLEQSLVWATIRGKYSMLLRQFQSDTREAEFFKDDGYRKIDFLGTNLNLPHGYWVHVRPFWYIWEQLDDGVTKDLRAWSPSRVVGEPLLKKEEDHGAFAWAPDPDDEGEDWLMVEFDQPVVPREIRLYEGTADSYLQSVSAFDLQGEEVEIHSGGSFLRMEINETFLSSLAVVDPESRGPLGFKTNRMRFRFESTAAESGGDAGAEVVAIGLVGELGEVQWVEAATASSFKVLMGFDESLIEELGVSMIEKREEKVEFRGLLGILNRFSERKFEAAQVERDLVGETEPDQNSPPEAEPSGGAP